MHRVSTVFQRFWQPKEAHKKQTFDEKNPVQLWSLWEDLFRQGRLISPRRWKTLGTFDLQNMWKGFPDILRPVHPQEQEPRRGSSRISVSPVFTHLSHTTRQVWAWEPGPQKGESFNRLQMQILSWEVWLKKRKTWTLFNPPRREVQVQLSFLWCKKADWDQIELAREWMLQNQDGGSSDLTKNLIQAPRELWSTKQIVNKRNCHVLLKYKRGR